MPEYQDWRGFEEEFRDFQQTSPTLEARYSSAEGKWIRCLSPKGERDRFQTLMALVATAAGFAGRGDPMEFLLDEVKQYLLHRNSNYIRSSKEVLLQRPVKGGSSESVEIAKHGQVFVICPLCQALADYCLERARQILSAEQPVQPTAHGASPAWKAKSWRTWKFDFYLTIASRSLSAARLRL